MDAPGNMYFSYSSYACINAHIHLFMQVCILPSHTSICTCI